MRRGVGWGKLLVITSITKIQRVYLCDVIFVLGPRLSNEKETFINDVMQLGRSNIVTTKLKIDICATGGCQIRVKLCDVIYGYSLSTN